MSGGNGDVEAGGVVCGLLSVIICNYNYAQFVGEAIGSALSIDWPNVEVIVIDDGSTDHSRKVIERFSSRLAKVLFRPNRGQAKASDEAYRHSRGEWILFLDSDDMVDREIIKEAVATMKPGWSMIQFQMRVVDESGKPTGSIFPKYRKDVTPELIRRWILATDSYPTPPGSGNLLSRQFLQKIFPLEEGMDAATDSYFLSTAPLLGDVLTVDKPMISYRVHGKNDGSQSQLDVARVQRDFGRHIVRCNYATRMAEKFDRPVVADRWRYGFYNLAMRLASLRFLRHTHPVQGDGLIKCLRDISLSALRPQGLTPPRHLFMLMWLLAVTLLPTYAAQQLISWRFAPPTRPRVLQRFIQAA